MSKEMIMVLLFTLNPNCSPNHSLQCFVFQEFSLEARQTTWRCSKKTKKGICTGAIRVGENFLVAKIHNHPGDHKKVTELKIRSKVIYSSTIIQGLPGRVAQLVTCLATDASLTADPGVASSIPARSHTFVEIDHKIISTVILLPSNESFKKGCCQLQAKVCARSTG